MKGTWFVNDTQITNILRTEQRGSSASVHANRVEGSESEVEIQVFEGRWVVGVAACCLVFLSLVV
jgi:hypothetical protein